ncbi:hypothetical protein [Flavobacterium psychrotolerans]|uniref:Replication-associated protein G2P N-terminal domain-containing protein n=1 Tax=Flavobacterium psychrotolerans TaxID=2169410 RepID=A0A2U1JLD1_9FLAO|nr:hypothetical protein [Flavobacterium psychrotolerans]PWA05683.1 hypothetical protein DB895_06795 [Flavobacterium psychrotolerans]
MLDLLKFRIIDKILIDTVWNNDLLEYVGKSERLYSDEIKEKQTKKYKNLYFTKHQNRLEISGSIHYFFNDELHNADDFYIEYCINAIIQIKNLFNLDLNKCYLVNLEYGVNINPRIKVSDLIHNLIYHEKRQFARTTTYFDYKQAGNEAYKQIKAYDKSVQFPHECENTFRFEIRTRQAKFIHSLGLFTLQDLTIIDNYNVLIASLLKEWDNILLFDLSKDIDTKFFNTNFWEDILKNGSRNKFNNQKKLYHKKLGTDNLHTNIRKIIERRTKYLKCVHIPTITKMETAQVRIVF